MTIMIVDDNKAMRKTIRSVAAAKSDNVIECDNGADAVSSFELHHPDWVLMDINLPQLDGISATKKIIDGNPSARVVMVTDSTEPSFRSAAHNAGACGYVSKENLFEICDVMKK